MLIKNARDYEGRICDYLIADGKIRAIGTDLPEAGEVINAKGLTILPAFIDTHCHWRTPKGIIKAFVRRAQILLLRIQSSLYIRYCESGC